MEELAPIPYRYYRHFEGPAVIRADGTRVLKARSSRAYFALVLHK